MTTTQPKTEQNLFQFTDYERTAAMLPLSSLDGELYSGPEVPRSPLAEYVIGQLPQDLAHLRGQGDASDYRYGFTYQQLRDKHAAVLEHYAPLIAANTDPIVAEEVQLDLAFMLGSYLHPKAAGVQPPALLQAMLGYNATHFGLPKYMDYELIIDVNSREYLRTGRMRTYLQGEEALSERDFYLGHYLATPSINSAAFALRGLLDDPKHEDSTAILQSSADNMKTFVQYMKAYMNLDKDHFAALRPYLASYPDGTRNASGAFIPGVQFLELTLKTPSEGQNVFLEESIPYMPRWGRPVVRQWRNHAERGHNVQDLLGSGDLQLEEEGLVALKEIVRSLVGFRMAHRRATYKQIAEAFEEDAHGPIPKGNAELTAFGEPPIMEAGAAGTAGFSVRNLLTGSISRTIRLLNELNDTEYLKSS